MKRDPELVRELLLYFERKPDDKVERCPAVAGHSESEIKYHLLLLDEAGFLRCERQISTSSNRVIKIYPFSLTWQGHEFLEAARNDALWAHAKRMVLKKAGGLSFEVLKSLLIKLAKDSVGLPLAEQPLKVTPESFTAAKRLASSREPKMRLNLSVGHPNPLLVVLDKPDGLERHNVGMHVLDVAFHLARECP